MSVLDGIDAARRAGWAKAYAADEAHARAYAIAVCLISLVHRDGRHNRHLPRIAAEAHNALYRDGYGGQISAERWNEVFDEYVTTFQSTNPLSRSEHFGWPISDSRCV